MGKVIVIQFVTLDGVVEDPDGRGGTPFGGWAFRFGPEAVAGDKFRLGPVLQSGVLLFGRQTWEHFSRLWPARTDPFSTAMNALPKVVVTRGAPDLSAWSNSTLLEGELAEGVLRLRQDRDVVVIGSTSVVRQLAAAGAVDEYRLLTFPTILGDGARLLTTPVDLELVSVDVSGAATLATYAAS
ncbi:dihydrofolate reductase family protein [Pedococcus sp. 5OH_020]|uniref:dihydrofolate reductase family protein n=1 Tax=Pedococcus sp. 5OH_020 TaxID=2989814 RepID=UPI0022E9E5C0|nr:dihydrofolate reductase family protein [Pedococcus sp. 5OH_020]